MTGPCTRCGGVIEAGWTIHPGLCGPCDTTLVNEKHQRWMTEVRDPASVAPYETITIRSRRAHAKVKLAPIPAGWAGRYDVDYPGGCAASPWCGPYPTRDEAERAMLDEVARATSGPACGGRRGADLIELHERILAHDAQPDLFSGAVS